MTPTRKGSIHIFRFRGIDVYLHWSWFLVAYFMVSYRMQVFGDYYSSMAWYVYDYLALFAIVLLHEFGHSLACRSVGGRADQIVLWPLGGVAYVDPPLRPGATLWSIAAGPLVNVLLAPIFGLAWAAGLALQWPQTHPDLYRLFQSFLLIDIVLFCFNMLPIYPLDGGKIVWSLLWFWLGRARSLLVASSIGLVVVPVIVVLSVIFQHWWWVVMGGFMLINCWNSFQYARGLSRLAAAPRRAGLACPHCRDAPPLGTHWVCGRCRASFDMFATRGICPGCGTIFNATRCLHCGEAAPLRAFGDLGGS